MKVAWLSALPLPPRQYPWYMFNRNVYRGYYLRLSGIQGYSEAENIKLKKNL
jgi:hypothetical protein